jgi:hypothetical protein
MEQPAKQPQNRETARDLQKETQGRKSQQLENEGTKSLERRQVLKRNMKATSTTNLHRWKASRSTTARRTTTRWQPTTPSDVSTIHLYLGSSTRVIMYHVLREIRILSSKLKKRKPQGRSDLRAVSSSWRTTNCCSITLKKHIKKLKK